MIPVAYSGGMAQVASPYPPPPLTKKTPPLEYEKYVGKKVVKVGKFGKNVVIFQMFVISITWGRGWGVNKFTDIPPQRKKNPDPPAYVPA